MILEHFTAAHFLPRIRREGLTRGSLPWNLDRRGRPTLVPGFQWFTTNADFHQPWCLLGNLPYARNAVRLTVLVPPPYEARVFSWAEMCRRCRPDCADEINASGGDVESWRVFRGPVPPGWIISETVNFGARLAPDAKNRG